jgi:uncharacterized protein (DUF1697 family)
MTRYVALLRAVNLAGRRSVSMSDLRLMLDSLGLAEPRSLLQSGNVVFGSRANAIELEGLLETETEKRFGLRTEYFVRSAREWSALVAANPFRAEAERDPAHLLVLFLKDTAAPARVRALQKAIAGRELVRASGRQAYAVYPDGIGRSRLTIAIIEKHLSTHATGRNWNTVLKLGALAKEPDV